MPTAVWNDGAADGNWSNTASWTGGSGTGGVPGSGDDVLVATGSTNIATNTTAFSAVNIASLTVGQGFRARFGGPSAKISFGTIATLDYSSYGEYGYIDATPTMVRVKDGVVGDDWLHLDGTMTTLRVSGGRGRITVDDGAALTNLYNTAGDRARIVVSSNVTGFTLAELDAGDTTFNVACATVEANGGILTWAGTGGASTKLTLQGGTVRYNSSGTIANLIGYSGLFDGTRNQNAAVAMTAAEIHEGCAFDLRSGLRNWSSPVVYYGGVIYWDAGQTVSVS